MEKLTLGFEVSVDEATGKPRAAYLRVREGEVAETREASPGKAYADYDVNGRLLGVEFLSPCEVAVVDKISLEEPEQVRGFLRGAVPRELVYA